MQKLYPWVIACILLLASAIGYAQEKPHPLGRTADVLKSFRQQMQLSQQQRGINRLVLRISATDSLPGKVNFRQTDDAGYECLAGEIDSIPGSSFMIRIQGNQVQGHIILRKSKKAWTWYSDVKGNVHIKETDIHKVLCIDYEQAPASASVNNTSASKAEATLAAVTNLQSFPEANGCVLLDFDGQVVKNPNWNNGNPINAAPSPLTDDQKYEVWQQISEDFRPFSLNITTSEAVYLTFPANRRTRCIFTPTNTAAPGSGGVAYLNSFTWGDETPCWVFNGGQSGAGEGGSHEIGHTFGLSHDGKTIPAEEYYSGQGNWSPIMGGGANMPLRQWSKGEYARPTNTEDDLNIFSGMGNGIGYRTDDYGGTMTTASALALDSTGGVTMQGIISSTGDVDLFSFTTTGGNINLVINPAEKHPNLDIIAVLYNSAGNVTATSNPTGLSANISLALSAGTYFLSIAGAGSGDPAVTGYSTYGSLGAYRIKGTIAGTKPNTAATFYQRCGYWGTFAKSLAPGTYTTDELIACGINDNDISSFKVNSGYEVLLYNEDYLQGSFTRFTSNAPCLDSFNLNNTASSLRIRAITNQLPVVTFVKPLAGSIFLAPATLDIRVNASDADGRISKVEFFNNGVRIGEDLVAPYTFQRFNVPVGSYVIKAIATDDRGGISEAKVPITVTNVPVATVYQDCDFGGYGIGLTPGTYTLTDLYNFGLYNDDISSLKVTNGYQVQLYEHDNFGGSSVTITANNACLVPENFNDFTSSIIISAISSEPVATVFPHCHFGGPAIALAPGTYTRSRLHLLGIIDNDISSLKVNSGYQVLLYDGDFLTGVSQAFNADNACLVSTSYNDMTSSIHIKEIMPPPAKPSDEQVPGHSGLKLSPNPVGNELRLISKDTLTGAVIQVYNVMGRKVLTAINTNNRLNVSHLSPGVYSLTIIIKGKRITSRFIK
jgi:hypothetical protein